MASPSSGGMLTSNSTTNQSPSNVSNKNYTGYDTSSATQAACNQINSLSDNNVPVSTASIQIKKKSSSFLHRDYNRKPILARSQVSNRAN